MKTHFSYILVLFLTIISCKNNDEKLLAENIKDAKKKEIIFANINKSWVFNATPSNPTAQNLTTKWTEWRIFLDEISKKPKSTILAFQQKAKNLSKKAVDLNQNIPPQFNGPAIKSRITVLRTKINMLELYINLSQIPDAKVIALITEINTEVASLQLQMNEITIKSQIKTEDGEQDLIRMMDTTRAVPSVVLPVR
jgi:hypothetical protein